MFRTEDGNLKGDTFFRSILRPLNRAVAIVTKMKGAQNTPEKQIPLVIAPVWRK
jgi:hypothetical protein